jgi:transposase
MPKKAYLSTHLGSDQLKEQYLRSSEPVESRRWHLLWLISTGWTIKKASEAIGINYDYAKEILQNYNQQGIWGIKNKKRQPRGLSKTAFLDSSEQQQLKKELQQPPEDGGIWTGPKVARWIAKKIGKEKVWPQRGWDYLKRLNYSPQSPRTRHYKADQDAQEEFKKKSQI